MGLSARGLPLIVALQDEDREQRRQRICDCGVPKLRGAECCSLCAHLDGIPFGIRGDGHPFVDKGCTAQIVATLREEGLRGLTLHEVAQRVKTSTRNTLRRLQDLERNGRVRSWIDHGTVTTSKNAWGIRTALIDAQYEVKRYRLIAG